MGKFKLGHRKIGGRKAKYWNEYRPPKPPRDPIEVCARSMKPYAVERIFQFAEEDDDPELRQRARIWLAERGYNWQDRA